MIFPISAYGNTRVYEKFPRANEKSLHVNGTFKNMEEKPYFRMGYLYILDIRRRPLLEFKFFYIELKGRYKF